MDVTYINHMGDDLTIVNAARVSFNKESQWEVTGREEVVHLESRSYDVYNTYALKESDRKLIEFLAKHKHKSPFGHPQITVRVWAPIFIARQLFKHKVGFVENEVSRRYVDNKPEIFYPIDWGKRSDNKKQGSDDILTGHLAIEVGAKYHEAMQDAVSAYEELIGLGVAPEDARLVLPLSLYTEWYWTGSLLAYARMYNLRSSPDAQRHTRYIAKEINKIVEPLFPVSWPTITKKFIID